MPQNNAIKLLGELALQVDDLERMKTFYRDVVGLGVYNEDFPEFVFFRVADAAPGHPQILGLFDRNSAPKQPHSTLDHFAFVIELAEYEREHERLQALGVDVVRREFPHFHWRSLFFTDPEGNTLELVCHDPALSRDQSSP